MDYKQHKGDLRGKIKDKKARKLYNKKRRQEGKIVYPCTLFAGELNNPKATCGICGKAEWEHETLT